MNKETRTGLEIFYCLILVFLPFFEYDKYLPYFIGAMGVIYFVIIGLLSEYEEA